jgi:hypothetical protein
VIELPDDPPPKGYTVAESFAARITCPIQDWVDRLAYYGSRMPFILWNGHYGKGDELNVWLEVNEHEPDSPTS